QLRVLAPHRHPCRQRRILPLPPPHDQQVELGARLADHGHRPFPVLHYLIPVHHLLSVHHLVLELRQHLVVHLLLLPFLPPHLGREEAHHREPDGRPLRHA
ncbi:unnamed protein product, partial [Musa hybrid cultivar]